MSKYLELVEGSFNESHFNKQTSQNPYVAYSIEDDKVIYSIIPKPVTGPASNEIWYKTTDGEKYDLDSIIATLTSEEGATYNGPTLISNEFDNEKQMFVMKFDGDVSVLGIIMDTDTETITINGPFFLQSDIETVVLPNTITHIEYAAFTGCYSLTSITIPNSVTSIGYYAFVGCSSLTSITIPNSVTSIGDNAFGDCPSLTSPVYNAHCFAYMPTSYSGAYTIPEGIKQIAGGAFAGCSSLTSITIPDSVTSIGEYTFYDCSSLTSIESQGTMEQWNAISKGGDWKYDVPATEVICTDGIVTIA